MKLVKLFVLAIFIVLAFLLTGCSTAVPVTAKFPEIPERVMLKCPQLQKLEQEAKLSDVAKTVTANYSTYYDCAVKHDAFVEWYQIQKKIYEDLK